MTNESQELRSEADDPTDASTAPSEQPAPPTGSRGIARGTGYAIGQGEGEGTISGTFMDGVRQSLIAARMAAARQRPAVERATEDLLERAEAAGQAALPHIERAAQEAAAFARDHQDELKTAAARAARIAVRLAVPPALRNAVEEELAREQQAKPASEPADEPEPPTGEQRRQ